MKKCDKCSSKNLEFEEYTGCAETYWCEDCGAYVVLGE